MSIETIARRRADRRVRRASSAGSSARAARRSPRPSWRSSGSRRSWRWRRRCPPPSRRRWRRPTSTGASGSSTGRSSAGASLVGIPATAVGAYATRGSAATSLVTVTEVVVTGLGVRFLLRPGDPHEIAVAAGRLPAADGRWSRPASACSRACSPTPAGSCSRRCSWWSCGSRSSSRSPRRSPSPRSWRSRGRSCTPPLGHIDWEVVAGLRRRPRSRCPTSAPGPRSGPTRSTSSGPTAPAWPLARRVATPARSAADARASGPACEELHEGGCRVFLPARPLRGPRREDLADRARPPCWQRRGEPEADPRGDRRPPPALLPGPARGGRARGRHDLLGAPGRAGRRERGQGPQGPLLPRLLRHPRRRLRRRLPPPRDLRASSASPATGRSPSSASATWAGPSPTTVASAPAAFGSLALVDADADERRPARSAT